MTLTEFLIFVVCICDNVLAFINGGCLFIREIILSFSDIDVFSKSIFFKGSPEIFRGL